MAIKKATKAKKVARSRKKAEAEPLADVAVEVIPAVAHPLRFPRIVAIGASIAGLSSVRLVLQNLPATTGATFVLMIPDGDDAEALRSLLAEDASMPISTEADAARLEADHLFIVTGRAALEVRDDHLRRGKVLERPLDAFFREVAAAATSHAVAVVLSGRGSDGALGVQAIKAEGGICFAEHDSSAAANEMPRAAIAAGAVDSVLAAREIGLEIARVARELDAGYGGISEAASIVPPVESEEDIKRLFAILRRSRDVDFTHYRPTTIRRRIARRMMLFKMHSLGEYIQYLTERPAEIEALYQDILIKVTHFFRDAEMFEALKTRVFPEMLQNRGANTPVRVWVPGCATGEEPYSIAIVLLEMLGDLRTSAPIQIFATDVSEAAIEKARSAIYLENISLDVSPERLRRFFTKVDHHYQINKSIRDICVFAKQNVTRDPPFSKLDLITCRNVLIYLEPILQKKVIPMFHYALRPEGRLILGMSETITGSSDLFVVVDKHVKIYAKNVASPRMSLELSSGHYAVDRIAARAIRVSDSGHGIVDIQREADRIVIGRYAPAGVIITGDLQILQFRGQTGSYLEPAPGEPSVNVLRMAREGMMLDLRAAIERAKRTDQPARKEGVRVRSETGYRQISLEVIPIRDPRGEETVEAGRRYFLVLFEEPTTTLPAHSREPRPSKKSASSDAWRVRRLEEELVAAKGYLQAIIEEQEATNEELQSANEEILSSNEELQSINEELETAKEELQSTNEELTTLNEELEIRNKELSIVNGDLTNLLASVNIAIVMLSRDLRIQRFTPLAEHLMNLIPSDLGRPIGDIKPRFDAPDLEQIIALALENGGDERDVRDRDGHWYSMRIRAYRAADKRLDGAVISLLDIDAAKRASPPRD